MTDDARAHEIEQQMRDRVKELLAEQDATPIGRIRKRIADLQRGPKRLDLVIVHDQERNVWLGEQEWWSDDQREDRPQPPAAEGATPAEVLRKLAEMLE